PAAVDPRLDASGEREGATARLETFPTSSVGREQRRASETGASAYRPTARVVTAPLADEANATVGRCRRELPEDREEGEPEEATQGRGIGRVGRSMISRRSISAHRSR